jgi:hypothetical protein
MRTFTIIAAMALLTTCTSAAVAGGPVELRIAGSGAYATETERKAVAVFDDETYTALWAATIDENGGEMAPVDFETESAVVLFGGQRNTGGYIVDVRGAAIEGDTLVVDAVVKGPGGGSIVTQALTQPWVVIAVKNRRFKDVRWEP